MRINFTNTYIYIYLWKKRIWWNTEFKIEMLKENINPYIMDILYIYIDRPERIG